MKTRGQLIAQARRELGLTQAAVSEMLHVSREAVSRWERRGACPRMKHWLLLMEILGLEKEDYFKEGTP